MLLHCFVWGFALLGHCAVNCAPQPLERQKDSSAAEDELVSDLGLTQEATSAPVDDEQKLTTTLEDQDKISKHHFDTSNGDTEGEFFEDDLPPFPQIKKDTAENFQDSKDSDASPTSVETSDGGKQLSTTLIPEKLEEDSEISSRNTEKVDLSFSSSILPEFETLSDSPGTLDAKDEIEGNRDYIPTKFPNEDSSVSTRSEPSLTDSPVGVNGEGSQLLKSASAPGEIEESDNPEEKPDPVSESNVGDGRNVSTPEKYDNRDDVEVGVKFAPLTSEVYETPGSSESTPPATTGLLVGEEGSHEITSGIDFKDGIDLEGKDQTTSDSSDTKVDAHSVDPPTTVSRQDAETVVLAENTDEPALKPELGAYFEEVNKYLESIATESSSSFGNVSDATTPVIITSTGTKLAEVSDLAFRDDGLTLTSEEEDTQSVLPQSTTETETPPGVSGSTQVSPVQGESVLPKVSTNPPEKSLDIGVSTSSSTGAESTEFVAEHDKRYVSGNNTDTVAAVQFLHYHDKESSEQCFKLVSAHWDYATNLTEENKIKQLEQTFEYSQYHKRAWKNATAFAWKSFNDTLLRRWFKSLSILGNSALPEDKLNEFNRLKADMGSTYSTAKVCSRLPVSTQNESALAARKCDLSLEPDLTRILTKSRDYDELTHVWKSWRDSAGKPIRAKYLRLVELGNEAARLNGFADAGDMWREAYESETFKQDLDHLWDQLRPLYEHLHAYIRRKLVQQYSTDKIREDGPIPAHLFGNMWAQSWVSLLDIAQPFPGKPSVDVTSTMEAKNMSALEMFQISDEFFTSLGLKPMPEEFWRHSIIEKPEDREIICHASAWDFCNGKDYRIKQCTDRTMEDLITVHHEMGHIQYFLQYARQPNVFREGANPGFHEAIGDVLALSVSTPKHLQSIGLLEDVADDPEGDLNFLLRTALDHVSFIPFGYLIDLWRWGLFSGEIKPEEMNAKWWELRLQYQGICPPVKRTETDFDPGAKFHVPGNVPYIRYFVSFVIQFQFHKVLCDAAGHTGPLYKCDIYRSKEAGQILSQVMELGSSEHWSEAMKIMTGGATGKMDAQPILEYFQPLHNWLQEQNKDEMLGWKSNDATSCP